ncbi:DUF418 domain-containing protein [Bacillus atrophaeus]|uniref:DUF418 domain-containing protein n=1 Tax=Bacillus atrophaeus TaxID=1452 RepID=UPI0022817D35|nr:DUF418 domain-containing protein [Bacillus atrophaeus]MCY7946450.1 DUF418 domain-containing protein [Bacillus atrophaeus]MCY8095261.1 DUF418 domain-containing protein [Bacillus atrophaeus]MCY9167010.1 DUF418 domain-containing protein [Bacillus atrophaeus]MEC0740942.1 DUF418 domain-containing protein [Bacillus atrophaeus]MEC0745742.1 DUF418 domain-containing protein [Bacillus atrophaeus]
MNQSPAPTQSDERIVSLDLLRGISILGILLVNIFDFKAPMAQTMTIVQSMPGTISFWCEALIAIFIEGSFYPLFSFLFGTGAILFYERIRAKGLSFGAFYTRRLLVLTAIGILHAVFVWSGDILFTYGILGFLLFFFLKRKKSVLLIWAVCLYCIPYGILSLLMLLMLLVPAEEMQDLLGAPDQTAAILQHGSFGDITAFRFSEWLTENVAVLPLSACIIVPCFLIGIYAYKRGWFEKEISAGVKSELLVLMWCSLAAGLLLKLTPVWFGWNMTWIYIQQMAGGPILALGYVSGFLLLWNKKRQAGSVLRMFSYVGRLSLTQYLFQTIFLSLFFYGYGLGFYGMFSSAEMLGIALIFYACQLVFSRLWVQTFRYGPFEYVWRKLTYWRLPAFRKE